VLLEVHPARPLTSWSVAASSERFVADQQLEINEQVLYAPMINVEETTLIP
jgi:hypothetical protein